MSLAHLVVGIAFRGPAYLFCVQFPKDLLTFLESHWRIYSEHHRLSSPESRLCNRDLPAQSLLGSELKINACGRRKGSRIVGGKS